MTDTTDKPTKPTKSAKALKQRMTPLERAQANPKNVKLAIAAHCYDCRDDGSDNPHLIKATVRDCDNRHCALWPHRGWQKTTTRKPWGDPAQIPPK